MIIHKKYHIDLWKDPEWKEHTKYHYSQYINGERLDYWPTRYKWRFRNKTYRGLAFELQDLINKLTTES